MVHTHSASYPPSSKHICKCTQNEAERTDGVQMTKTLTWRPLAAQPPTAAPVANNGGGGGAAPRRPQRAGRYELSLALDCSDGFSAGTRVTLDAADFLLFNECVRFALPHLLGLHGAFRLPVREDYYQDDWPGPTVQ